MVEPDRATFEASNVLRMFPTFVWKAQVAPPVRKEIEDHVLAKLAELRRDTDELVSMPVQGQGWQSDADLHHLDAFGGLIDCIQDGTKTVLEFLKSSAFTEENVSTFEITGLWANMNPKGAAHAIHSHPNNFLSGIYYVRTHAGADTVNFHDPRPQTGIIRPPVTELTAENTDQVVVKVSNGTLLMFPSWLPHSVDPNDNEETRVSLSFNIMSAAFTETMSKPMW